MSGAGDSGQELQGGPRPTVLTATHMIPLFWAMGVHDRADRV